MTQFPDSARFIIIDDLYTNYDLAFEDSIKDVHIYCETCGEVVGTLDYEDIKPENERSLYEVILETHRKI